MGLQVSLNKVTEVGAQFGQICLQLDLRVLLQEGVQLGDSALELVSAPQLVDDASHFII